MKRRKAVALCALLASLMFLISNTNADHGYARALYESVDCDPDSMTVERDNSAYACRDSGGVATTIYILSELYEDFDNDGSKEFFVSWGVNQGGSGTFVSYGIFDGGKIVSEIYLGDRVGVGVGVEGVSFEDGVIVSYVIMHDDDDPLCCPTKRVRRLYAFGNGVLKQIGADGLWRESCI